MGGRRGQHSVLGGRGGPSAGPRLCPEEARKPALTVTCRHSPSA